MADENDLIFCEVQKFSLRIRLFVVFSMVLAVIFDCFALHKMLSQQETSKVLPITSLIIFGILLPVAIGILFLMLKMQTEVRNEALYVRFFPFHIHYKKFTANDISESYARTYRPLLEYGGWGIKCSWRGGRAYNVSGNQGVQLIFKNNKRLLIGSQKPNELAQAISLSIKNA